VEVVEVAEATGGEILNPRTSMLPYLTPRRYEVTD
jgi:hypothetical protein